MALEGKKKEHNFKLMAGKLKEEEGKLFFSFLFSFLSHFSCNKFNKDERRRQQTSICLCELCELCLRASSNHTNTHKQSLGASRGSAEARA